MNTTNTNNNADSVKIQNVERAKFTISAANECIKGLICANSQISSTHVFLPKDLDDLLTTVDIMDGILSEIYRNFSVVKSTEYKSITEYRAVKFILSCWFGLKSTNLEFEDDSITMECISSYFSLIEEQIIFAIQEMNYIIEKSLKDIEP